MQVEDSQDGGVGSGRLTREMTLLIGICALVYFLDGLVHTVLGPLAPEIARALSLKPAQLGPIFSANLIGQCIGLVTVPLLVPRLGHRLIVIIMLLGFGVAQGATALADTAGELFVFRLITGIFLGGCLPSCLALVTACAPIKRRGIAIMMLFTGYGMGATVAGVVPVLFAQFGGWKTTLAAISIVCLTCAVIAWIWLKEVRAPQGQASIKISAEIVRPTAIFSRRLLVGTIALWLLFISMLTISYCLNSWLPILLVEVGREESLATISVSIFSLGGIVAALGVGLLIDRFGSTIVLVTSLTISSVLLFLIGQVLASAPVSVLLLLLGVCGFFVLGAYGGINVVLASYYPDALRAVGIGWTKSVGRVGSVMAPIMIGVGLSAGMPETMIMSLFAVPAAVAALALLVIWASEGRRRDVGQTDILRATR